MEEDIKILEEYIENLFKYGDREILEKENIIKCIEYKEIQAIENLLKRYKELKEKNERLIIAKAEALQEMRKYKAKLNDVIPISVIQNKINELTKYRDLAKEQIEERVVIADSDSLNYGRAEAHDKDIQVLKEILEKRNK